MDGMIVNPKPMIDKMIKRVFILFKCLSNLTESVRSCQNCDYIVSNPNSAKINLSRKFVTCAKYVVQVTNLHQFKII